MKEPTQDPLPSNDLPSCPQTDLPPSPQPWRKVTLLCLSLVNLTAYLTMSIIAPFFPYEASVKGMPPTVSGLVFSVYALVMMIASPIIGKFMPQVGVKFTLLAGIWLSGCSNVLFGVLGYVDHTLDFTILCFAIRAVGAVGAAAFSTASYTYIIQLFPDNIGLAFGLTETCVGIGMSLGPAVGGLLYGMGGFPLPFYVLGSFILTTGPLCMLYVQSIEVDDEEGSSSSSSSTSSSGSIGEKATYRSVLGNPKVFVICIVLATATSTQGFLDPTIEPHLRQFGTSPEMVGLVFLAMSGAYAISSPISGYVCGKTENKMPIMVVGLLMTAFGYTLLGPSGFIPLDPSYLVSTGAMVIIGLAYSLAFIPTFETILEICFDQGLQDDVRTYSLVSGLWSCVNSLGEVTGAGLGGFFMEYYSFTVGSNFVALWATSVAILLMVTFIFDLLARRRRRRDNRRRFSSLLNARVPRTRFSSTTTAGLHRSGHHGHRHKEHHKMTISQDETVRLLMSGSLRKSRNFTRTIP